ncbi:MAG TPA: helix-turn-helix transcriptional regulator [Flavobacterium sp.]|nr:helix-turn-helix transcriptional regulator [Flavobacterium sp.]
MSKIGYNIKKLRSVKNLSQQAFAELFNLTRGNISSYEELRAEPKIEVIIKIANYFSIPLEHFLTKPLSVNEILNFSDYFNEEQQRKILKNFANIPFLNRSVIQKIKDGSFDFNEAEMFSFPIYSSQKFIALELSQDVAVPLHFPFTEPSILFFEQVQIENLHTLHNNFGLYLHDNELFIGTFQQEQSSIELKLNEWKSHYFTEKNKVCFWKLYAKFEKII